MATLTITLDFFLYISTSVFTYPTPFIFSPVFERKMSLQMFQGQPLAGMLAILYLILWIQLLSLIWFASWLLPLPCLLLQPWWIFPYSKMSFTLTNACKLFFFFKTLFLKSIGSFCLHSLTQSPKEPLLTTYYALNIKLKYGHHGKTS